METENDTIKKVNFAKLGGTLALVSIFFLPLGGCGDATFTGLEVFKTNEVSAGIKMLLFVSIACGVGAYVVTRSWGFFIIGGGGISSLLMAFTIARQDIPIDFKVGGYLTILGFSFVLFEGLRAKSSNLNMKSLVPSGTARSSSIIKNKKGVCPDCGAQVDGLQAKCLKCN